jgi:glycosyltransferase involved in cell wall biosynthesis
MRILFISAFYPPHVVGGWEQLVRDINVRLQARGHLTHVLTSTHGVVGPQYEPGVSRLLHMEANLHHYRPLDFLGHKRRLAENLAHVRRAIADFQPDVVFVHGMFNLSRGIAWQAEQLCPGRVVYYVANDWPHAPDPHTAYWTDPARWGLQNMLKRLLAPLPLRMIARENRRFALKFERVLCVSQAVKVDLAANAGIPSQNLQVVYNGVETDLFTPPAHPHLNGLSLLYAGSLVTHKGVHTAIEAMARLALSGQIKGITLSIVGSGHPDYEAHLSALVEQTGLQPHVHFLGRVPREEMPALLQKFNVLVFPSIWEEPLSRMMQEGMAAGLVVVGTLTGGSGELLVEGQTGLTFPPGNADVLAQRLTELQHNPALLARLAQHGRADVLARFGLTRMIDEIETSLVGVVSPQPA